MNSSQKALSKITKRPVNSDKAFVFLLSFLMAIALGTSMLGLWSGYELVLFFTVLICVFVLSLRFNVHSPFGHIALISVIFILLIAVFQWLFADMAAGITKSLGFFATLSVGFILVLATARLYGDTEFFVRSVVLFILVYGFINLFAELFVGISTERTSALGSFSKNYTSAALYLGLPLLLWYSLTKKKTKENSTLILMCKIAIFLIVINVILSASRTSLACLAVVAFSLLVFRSDNVLNKIVYICTLVIFIIIVLNMSDSSTQIGAIIERSLDAFNQQVGSDDRAILRELSQLLFESKNEVTKVLGSGDCVFIAYGYYLYPPHNLFYESLLTCGIAGTFVFIVGYSFIALKVFRKATSVSKLFLLQLLAIFLITAYVQPFFSTHTAFGSIVMMSLLAISSAHASKNETKAGTLLD